MGNTQSESRRGKQPYVANADLTEKAGYLAKLVSNSGVAEAALPAANDDVTLYVIENGGKMGAIVDLKPLNNEENFMIWAKGTGAAGDTLAGAAVSTAADKGKVRKLPATAGTYFSPGVAEEDFEDGQLVRIRPFPRLITVS